MLTTVTFKDNDEEDVATLALSDFIHQFAGEIRMYMCSARDLGDADIEESLSRVLREVPQTLN